MHKHIYGYFNLAEKKGVTPIGIHGFEDTIELYRADKLIGSKFHPGYDFSEAPFWICFSYSIYNMNFIPIQTAQELQVLLGKFLELIGEDTFLDEDGEDRFNQIVKKLYKWWRMPFPAGVDKIKDPAWWDEFIS